MSNMKSLEKVQTEKMNYEEDNVEIVQFLI